MTGMWNHTMAWKSGSVVEIATSQKHFGSHPLKSIHTLWQQVVCNQQSRSAHPQHVFKTTACITNSQKPLHWGRTHGCSCPDTRRSLLESSAVLHICRHPMPFSPSYGKSFSHSLLHPPNTPAQSLIPQLPFLLHWSLLCAVSNS